VRDGSDRPGFCLRAGTTVGLTPNVPNEPNCAGHDPRDSGLQIRSGD